MNTLEKVESSLKSEQSSTNSQTHQEVDMLDILLPKPVFKWQDPTLVPRFSHGLESEDADFNKIKNGTPRKTLHTIIHRMKFSDGKISWVAKMMIEDDNTNTGGVRRQQNRWWHRSPTSRLSHRHLYPFGIIEKPYLRCQNFQNLVSLIQDNGFQRNNSLFQLLLDQRLSVPFLFQSGEDPSQLNSFANALMNVKVNIGDENIILSDDITLPRVAFISNRSRRERNPKIIELALNSALVSGSSNVLKVRDLRSSESEPQFFRLYGVRITDKT